LVKFCIMNPFLVWRPDRRTDGGRFDGENEPCLDCVA